MKNSLILLIVIFALGLSACVPTAKIPPTAIPPVESSPEPTSLPATEPPTAEPPTAEPQPTLEPTAEAVTPASQSLCLCQRISNLPLQSRRLFSGEDG